MARTKKTPTKEEREQMLERRAEKKRIDMLDRRDQDEQAERMRREDAKRSSDGCGEHSNYM